MCGIFGCIVNDASSVSKEQYLDVAKKLYSFSETRGRDASGVCLKNKHSIYLHKVAAPPTELCQSVEFQAYFDRAFAELSAGDYVSFIGHTRLATNGLQAVSANNQPVFRDGICAIHNGIIVNVDEVWEKESDLDRTCVLDTELIPAILSKGIREGKNPVEAMRRVFELCSGSINTAVLFENRQELLLSTNVGSMFTVQASDSGTLVFASEKFILEQLCQDCSIAFDISTIRQVLPNSGLLVDLSDLKTTSFKFDDESQALPDYAFIPTETTRLIDSALEREVLLDGMKRCTRCVLPETFPFIEFDEDGVCNYCHSYKKIQYDGEDALRKKIASYPNTSKEADCILAFSGGRDSSYALHYVIEEMGMRPITYSYDWGMVTDLGRRNQARMIGSLGVEHILISADIAKKRANIRANLMAWLKKPSLGMIPLLMAGDKHYFYYANLLKKQTGIGASVWSTNEMERAYFKMGLCGVDVNTEKKRKTISYVPMQKRLGIACFYMSQYLGNPSYINKSIADSLSAYWAYYFAEKDYAQFYKYIPWKEDVIEKILLEEYEWEKAVDTETTWRIGDGTAPFYNHVYYMMCGFTENDTFRSNQVREGHITRDEALRLVKRDNAPRYPSMVEYMQLINVDINHALKVVAAQPTFYGYPDKLKTMS